MPSLRWKFLLSPGSGVPRGISGCVQYSVVDRAVEAQVKNLGGTVEGIHIKEKEQEGLGKKETVEGALWVRKGAIKGEG